MRRFRESQLLAGHGGLDKPRLKLSCGEPEESQLNVQKRDDLGLRDSTADTGIQGLAAIVDFTFNLVIPPANKGGQR